MKELICLKHYEPKPPNKTILTCLTRIFIPSLGEDQVLDIKHVQYKAKKFYPFL
jgi:hypothetical protein